MKFKNFRLLFVFIAFIMLCSYPLFLNLGKLSVRMWDEARNGVNAIEMLNDHNFIVMHFDGKPDMWDTKPPFFIWTVALSMKILGTNTIALRLPSALSCLAIMIYSLWFCRKYLNSIWAGVLSGFVLATSVGFIDYHVARNGDFEAMLSMWMFFYATQFYIYLEYRKKINLLLFALGIMFAILTKGIAGCLLFPGLLFFLFTNRNYLSVLKTRAFYVIPLLGLLGGVSYYFIRETINPGYISAMLENEITGRYTATNEGHSGTVWYYIDLLTNAHFKYWIYFIPLSFIFILFRGNAVFKRVALFLFIQTLFYLIVTSISHTKLPWYDAPLFPFFAMLIAIGLTQIFIELENSLVSKKRYLKDVVFSSFCILIFIVPVQNILATSIRGQKETYFRELFYGDFIYSVYTMFPHQKSISVISEGYNPHLIFYTKVWEKRHRPIKIIPPVAILQKGDSVLICEPKMFPKLVTGLYYDTILQEDNMKFFMRIISGDERAEVKKDHLFLSKINEIKNNPEWLTGIKDKASKNNVDLDKQIMLDALWNLKETKKISQETQDSLKVKYNL